MNESTSKRLPVTADIQNLIRILVEHNSTDPYAPIREYIANAHDATIGIKNPRISIYTEGTNLIVRDNGCGMTEQVIVDAFTKIAGTVKEGDDLDTIGEFGIGVLSAFMIAERLEVITKTKGAKDAWRLTWNRKEVEFELEKVPWEDTGTVAIMQLDDDSSDLVERTEIEQYIKTTFRFFDAPIYYGASNIPINKTWDFLADLKRGANKKLMIKSSPLKQLLQSLTRHPLEAVYYHRQSDGTEIFLGIPKNKHAPLGMHDVSFYTKGIKIHGNIKRFYPENLAFVIGVVNSPNFHVMISKELFKQNEMFHRLRGNIGTYILDFLETAGKKDDDLVQQIIHTHKSMLIAQGGDEPRIQKLLKKYHHFLTSAGELLWRDIVPFAHLENGKKSLHTTAKPIEAYSELMNMKGKLGYITIYAFNAEKILLEKIAQQDNIALVDMSTFETKGEIKDVPQPFKILAARISEHIIRLNIKGVVFVHNANKKAFPAMFRLRTMKNVSNNINAEPSLFADALMLNIAHPLISALASIKQPSEDIIERASDVLYQVALIHSPFSTNFSRTSNEIIHNLITFLEQTIGIKKKNKELIDGKAHCFVAFAYQDEFTNVFNGIDRTLSNSPYFWKVIRGDHFINGEFLLESIKNHLRTSQRFIADISGLNPNVLIELGLMIADDPDALLILCDQETFDILPSDLKGLLIMTYDKALREDEYLFYQWFKEEILKRKAFVALRGSLVTIEDN